MEMRDAGQIDRAGVSAAIAALFVELEGDIAARKPVCVASGRCCKFEAYGHRLYVTAGEMIHFAERVVGAKAAATVAGGGRRVSLGQFFEAGVVEGCPYQVEGLCTAREARPLGCRIYFCDANAQSWQNDVYELYHARLKELHRAFGVPYAYIEWRAALRELV